MIARAAAAVIFAGAGYLALRQLMGQGAALQFDFGSELLGPMPPAGAFDPPAFDLLPETAWSAPPSVLSPGDAMQPYGYTPDPYAGELDHKSISFANKNPINLRPGGGDWQGMTGTMTHPRAGTFLQFDTPENGYRAAAITLINYAPVYGDDTLAKILNRAAPREDQNDPDAYIARVSREVGVDPHARLDLKNDPETLVKILAAMTKVESGGLNPYRPETVREGVRRALARFGINWS